MKRLALIVVIAVTILFAFSATAQTVTSAGKYRITVTSRPNPPAQGENQLLISVIMKISKIDVVRLQVSISEADLQASN